MPLVVISGLMSLVVKYTIFQIFWRVSTIKITKIIYQSKKLLPIIALKMDGSLIFDIKSEPNYDDKEYVMNIIKEEGKHENDAETKVDAKYFGIDAGSKQEDEMLMDIKQEVIYIKSEMPTNGDYQNDATRICTLDKPNQEKEQHGLKEHFCDVCQYKTKLKANMTRHTCTHTGEKMFMCDICLYKASDKTHLIIHMRSHTGEKPYACDTCQYKGATKDRLKIHKKKHTGEKPYKCNICGYKTTTKYNLMRHVKQHTGEKPVQCNLCEFKSSDRTDLITHTRRIHTGERPYACNTCQYKATTKSDLNMHIRTHTGEKPYECNICQYKTAKQCNLARHKKTHGKETLSIESV